MSETPRLPVADENAHRRHELDMSAALGHDVRKDRRSPKPVMSDEEMTQLLKDALLNNRAFIAGRAFGVPEEAYPEHLKQVLEALLPVVKCVANEWDGGLEYARLYGVYPDGRKYHGSDT